MFVNIHSSPVFADRIVSISPGISINETIVQQPNRRPPSPLAEFDFVSLKISQPFLPIDQLRHQLMLALFVFTGQASSRERSYFNFLLTSLRVTGASSVKTPWNEYLEIFFFSPRKPISMRRKQDTKSPSSLKMEKRIHIFSLRLKTIVRCN